MVKSYKAMSDCASAIRPGEAFEEDRFSLTGKRMAKMIFADKRRFS
jgi:hypothetical protein